ncbi:MAG: prepilin-type N-terminal cleavage/methylation domain-containing protein [Phycisphaerae bacterium]
MALKRTFRADGTSQVRSRGFTLIELLVVVAIIALLISILLPSLSAARNSAKAVKCAANLSQVGKAVNIYLAENRGIFPPSYVYPKDAGGSWDPNNQPPGNNYGYLHWSYFLYGKGEAGADAFKCPNFQNGGAPRTNPGPKGEDWEIGEQEDDAGATGPSTGVTEDKQAPRMAYIANTAVMPRNKFTLQILQATVPNVGSPPRLNRFVRDTELKSAGNVILATEMHNNWKVMSKSVGSNFLSKSHRSINPFYHPSGDWNEFASPGQGFRMGPPGDATYGLQPLDVLTNGADLTSGVGHAQLNAVGRHHPGGDKWGGTANFMYCDGHVERSTVLKTIQDRRWGDKFYSLTGGYTELMLLNQAIP